MILNIDRTIDKMKMKIIIFSKIREYQRVEKVKSLINGLALIMKSRELLIGVRPLEINLLSKLS